MEKREILTLNNIPSATNKSRKATIILNDILRKNDKHLSTFMAFSTYPIQKWAFEIKNKMQYSNSETSKLTETANELIKKRESVMIANGIEPHIQIKDRNICMENTKEIIKTVETAVNKLGSLSLKNKGMYETVYKMHISNNPEQESLTDYAVASYYGDAMCIIADYYDKEFDKLIFSPLEKYNNLEEEYQFAYHNTEILVDIFRFVVFESNYVDNYNCSDTEKQSVINRAEYIKIVADAIKGVQFYPKKGKMLYQILEMTINGSNTRQIADKLNISPTYVFQKKKEAISVLSYLLWGYSTVEIVQDLNKYKK